MILISLSPFAFKRVLILVAAIIALTAVTCFGDSILLPVNETPYDHQMSPIRPILVAEAAPGQMISLARVNRWLNDLHDIPYGFSTQWNTPAELTERLLADCKGKAVALYQRMRANGATDLQLVIGKRDPKSQATHAWLEWATPSGIYVLDPTINRSAAPIWEISPDAYVPYYVYSGERKYRAVRVSVFLCGLGGTILTTPVIQAA